MAPKAAEIQSHGLWAFSICLKSPTLAAALLANIPGRGCAHEDFPGATASGSLTRATEVSIFYVSLSLLMNCPAVIFFLLMVLIEPSLARAQGANEPHFPSVHKLVFGLFLHDRGPTSDRHESGVDPNWEIQFKPLDWKYWKWVGSPELMAGMTPNFNGDTSAFYAGLSYEISLSNALTDRLTRNLTKNIFLSGGVSAALHNGPLHKNKIRCREDSDCGFGYRVLPRLNIELGTYFLGQHGLSLFYDHMSHKGVLPGENEGIDHVGLRYHLKFDSLKAIR